MDERMTYQRGDLVTVTVYGGSHVQRRVWADHGRGVEVCSEDDYERAMTQGIEPRGVGFPREDVLEIIEQAAAAPSQTAE